MLATQVCKQTLIKPDKASNKKEIQPHKTRECINGFVFEGYDVLYVVLPCM